MQTIIERALGHSASFTAYSRREGLAAESARLKELASGLLPVEAHAQEDIAARVRALDAEIELLDLSRELGSPPVLDQAVFAWTNPQKVSWTKKPIAVPQLAFIPITDSRCSIYVNRWNDVLINDNGRGRPVPKGVEQHYTKIGKDARRVIKDGNNELLLSYTYPGIVPEDIKSIIALEQKRERFEGLAFVCDAPQWQVQRIPAPAIYLDPILVGVKRGNLWVLATFDPTPVEQYISAEFTS